jgi:hypothetical protein
VKLKTVHYFDMRLGAGGLQAIYLDREANRLRPNLSFVHEDPRWGFEINEIGFKGDALDAERKLAVVWGDSVVFGAGPGWPCLLDRFLDGYQFLNGGIEGDHYQNILTRAINLNSERPIALNVILLGWHNVESNAGIADDLQAALLQIPNAALVTMPTALNRTLGDISDKFVSTADWLTDGFYFQESEEYSIAWQQRRLNHIMERNQIVREVAKIAGVPMIDLFAALDTEDASDFRENFFDIYHPRSNAYLKIAGVVGEGLKLKF